MTILKVALFFISITACISWAGTINTPTVKLEEANYPLFSDDLNFDKMEQAIDRQLDAYKRIPLRGNIKFGADVYSVKVLKETLILFKSIIKERSACDDTLMLCDQRLREAISSSFNIYTPKRQSLKPDGLVHFTAYYSPSLSGSLNQSETFKYPIYKRPKDLQLRKTGRIGIDFDGQLTGKGLELFYVKNLFELYLLHIEGGGAVVLQDGSRNYLSYAGTNKQTFRFISKYMYAKGMIDNKSVKSQRNYLESHPESWREIYSYCPSYVYFKEGHTEPVGLEDIPLTDNRSLAQDKKYYPRKGILAFVKAVRPSAIVKDSDNVLQMNYSRFYVDQDTGGAIDGEARADLYFGFGEYAKLASETVDHYGEMFYLVKKQID